MDQKQINLMAAVLLVLTGLAGSLSAQLPQRQGPRPAPQPPTAQSPFGQPPVIQSPAAQPQTAQPQTGQPDPNQLPGNQPPPLQFNFNDGRPAPSDPTIPSAEVRQMLEAGAAKPAQQAPPIPNLRILGRVLSKNRPPAAIIDVNGRSLLVRMDTEIIYSGNSPDQGTMTLKVIGLDTSGIKLQGGKQVWILH